jgi:hypothetical protein
MTFKEIQELVHGNWVTLRDGREGRFQEFHLFEKKENRPFVCVNLPNDEGPYSHNEWLWPAQIEGKRK